MRVGTSGFGVIAVVSVLVIAAPPERDDAVVAEGESGIDHSTTAGASRISSEGYSWQSQVTVETGVTRIPRSFVKIEFGRFGSPGPSRPTLVRRVRRTVETTETPTASQPGEYASSRELGSARNFADLVAETKVRSVSSVGDLPRKPTKNEIHRVDAAEPTLVYSTTGEFTEKFVVTLDSPLSGAIVGSSIMPPRRPPAAGERETIREGGRTENPKNNDDKVSTGGSKSESGNRRARSSGAKSAGTMNRLTTTLSTSRTKTSPRRSIVDEDFPDPTERYQAEMIRGSRDSIENGVNNGEARLVNGEAEVNDIGRTTERIISGVFEELPHSNSGYFRGYASLPGPTVDLGFDDVDRGIFRSSKEPGKSSMRVDDDPTRFARHGVEIERRETTLQSINDTASRKRETAFYSGVTEEISRSGQMTSDSSHDHSIFAIPHPRLSGNLANTSANLVPVFRDAASLDNHKAFKVPTRQSAVPEHQQHGQRAASSASLPTRFHQAVIDNVVRNPAATPNQITPPKSAYPVAVNQTKTPVNLVDARANKIFYEIKPSLITEMDHGDNVEVTPTPRKFVEKFFIPSVPSAFGKFGPYFLDEEDRRNVTERIGSTVQLDCRIGLLGHRKVTWLQHYKDSFRLLTVERESYSVDRRISLNFQYPNNWRLQIAYASLRDSGLYKCQVEIDQDRSLVKRYNVIITAPVLTITDDSGRPISGERHLKAGSALKLRCEARDVLQRLNESVLWMRGDETLAEDVSENRTTESVNEKDITVVVSTLLVERATPKHAGNYSCVVPDKARNTIAVHVLNGELPAAVQHGSGVSTAVLNLWLIHLTASYGFFR